MTESKRRETHIRVRGEREVKQGLWTKSSLLAALLSGNELLFASWCLLTYTVTLIPLRYSRTLQFLCWPARGSLSKEMLPVADSWCLVTAWQVALHTWR